MRRWFVFLLCFATFGVLAGTVNLNKNYKLQTDGLVVRFNPTKDADLQRLKAGTDDALATPEDESKHARRGLEEIQRLTATALAETDKTARETIELDLLETVLAVNNLERPPVPRHMDGVQLPIMVDQLSRPIGVGREPAINLQPGGPDDLSKRDPLPSTFWLRPTDIAHKDLSNGFGRTSRLTLEGKLCHYRAPKETAGMNPGYEVDCDGEHIKLKFGEQSSEPLTARMFDALGFHADPTDYSPRVKVAYDHRIFTEFNSRLPLETTFTIFWYVPLYTMNLQPTKDPFDYVASAVLRDGTRWTGAELKQHLKSGSNFVDVVEKQIDYIVTTPANVQLKDPHVKSIGPWDYGQLDHADRREVRGAGLLAAWLGFYDTRFDNTKLRLVGPKKHQHLEHYFSDLGGGLGQSDGLLAWHGENVNAFAWRFTASPSLPDRSQPGRPLRIVNYTPIVQTPAFAAMTIDDARWMARLIGQLRPEQIIRALEASGYDEPTVKLYTRKLVSRRNYMMKDLRLENEFPPIAAPAM